MADPQLVRLADQAARRHGVPVDLFRRLIRQESGWNPAAVSPAGARGLTQVVPKWHPNANLSTPAGQLDYGAKHLSTLLRNFGDPALALAAYNAGAGAVKKYGGIPPYAETQNYVKAILGGGGAQMAAAPPSPKLPALPELPTRTLDTKRLLMLLRNQTKRSLRGMMPAPNFRKELAKLAEGAYQPPPVRSPGQEAKHAHQAVTLASTSGGGGDYGWADQMAKQFGVKVTSTFRDPEHNRRVGGSPTSAHMRRGSAADFGGSPEAMRRLAEWAIRSGKAKEVFFDPLGYYWDNGRIVKGAIGGHSDHVHITWR